MTRKDNNVNIPKGTIKAISSEANQMYSRRIWLWVKISLPFWIWATLMVFCYWDNLPVIIFFNNLLGVGFLFFDSFLTFISFVMLVVSLTATVLTFDLIDRGGKIPSVFRLHQIAYQQLWSLLIINVLYLWRVCWKLLLLIVPGVLALADGIGYGFAFLIDGKKGQDAIRYSESIVRVNRVRYWDYLLVGILIPCLITIPFIIFMDQWAYFFRLKDLFYVNLLVEELKYLAMYFSVIYVLVFHYRVYQKFKTFLAS